MLLKRYTEVQEKPGSATDWIITPISLQPNAYTVYRPSVTAFSVCFSTVAPAPQICLIPLVFAPFFPCAENTLTHSFWTFLYSNKEEDLEFPPVFVLRVLCMIICACFYVLKSAKASG